MKCTILKVKWVENPRLAGMKSCMSQQSLTFSNIAWYWLTKSNPATLLHNSSTWGWEIQPYFGPWMRMARSLVIFPPSTVPTVASSSFLAKSWSFLLLSSFPLPPNRYNRVKISLPVHVNCSRTFHAKLSLVLHQNINIFWWDITSKLKLAIDYRSDQMSSKAYYESAVDKSVTMQTCQEMEFGCRGTNTEIDYPRIYIKCSPAGRGIISNSL